MTQDGERDAAAGAGEGKARPPGKHTLRSAAIGGPRREVEAVEVNPLFAEAGVRRPGPASGGATADAATAAAPASDLYDRAKATANAIRERLGGCAPEVGVILGSGMGAFAERLDEVAFLPYAEVPGFPVSTVRGHKGRLAYGAAGGTRVLALQGRFHFYEGYTLQQVTFPVRVLGLLGVRCLVVTNAAGGISPELDAGDLMLLADHLNLQGASPLEGPNDERLGPRFPDMTTCYPAALRRVVRDLAPADAPLKEGVYAALRGPSYETPAEVRMLRTLGADAVGMSTVPEVTVARHMGIPCVGISGIANKAAGLTEGHVLTHKEVVDTMAQTAGRLTELLRRACPALAAAVREGAAP